MLGPVKSVSARARRSDPQDLRLIPKADGHPVRLRGRPLQLVHLRAGAVRQDGVCGSREQRGVSVQSHHCTCATAQNIWPSR